MKRLPRLVFHIWSLFLASSIESNDEEMFASCPATSPTNRTAIVIGAGPAGLATCLGLSPHCAKIYLVEKHKSFDPRGATTQLAPNGRKALDELSPGLSDELETLGMAVVAGGSVLLPWWELRDTLLARVRQRPNIEWIMGDVLETLVDDGSQVQLTLKHSGKVVNADFCVGADGSRSSVRAWLGLPPAVPTGTTVFRGHVHDNTTLSFSPALLQVLNQGGVVPFTSRHFSNGVHFMVFNFHSKHPGKIAWVVSSTRKDIPRDQSVTPWSLIKESQVVTDPEQLSTLQELFQISDPRHMLPDPESCVVDMPDNGEWGGRGLVTLVGDAAHAMRPTDGQGGNQAFEDAVVLSRIMKKKLHQQENSPLVALREFEAERLSRVKVIHDDQRIRYERKMAGQLIEPWTNEFRDWVEGGV